MTQELFTKFAEIVSNGQIKGVEYAYGDIFIPDKILVATVDLICVAHGSKEGWKETQYTDLLCAHIRRVLGPKAPDSDIGWGYEWELGPKRLEIWEDSGDSGYGGIQYDEGSELDWHVAAILAHIERSGEPEQAVTK